MVSSWGRAARAAVRPGTCRQRACPAEPGAPFSQLREAVTKHARGEERVVHPALEDSGDPQAAGLAREAAVEHERIDPPLARTMRPRTASEHRKARACVVRELLEHPIDEEQGEMYDTLARVCAPEEMQETGGRFQAGRQRFRRPAGGATVPGTAARAAH